MNTNRKKKKKNPLTFVKVCICVVILLLDFTAGVIVGREGFLTSSSDRNEDISGSHPQETDSQSAETKEPLSDIRLETAAATDSDTDSAEDSNTIDTMIAGMTLEEKVAQMFMITPEALTGVGTVIAAGDTTRDAIDKYPVGGLIYFEKNLQTPEQVKTMISNVLQYSRDRIGLPMFINVDEEGGTVSRFGNNSSFSLGRIDDMSVIGAGDDPEAAYLVGSQIGSFLYELGFNMDNAPVADVLSNEANTVIGRRSFGSDCKTVSSMAIAELNGLKSEGIVGVYKHFPGHGATEADTHEGYAYTNASLEEMLGNDLVPFTDGIQHDVKVIMVAHIACPNVTGDDTPASLSSVMITDILRGKLGYEGIVMTDGLNMGAIANQYSSAEAAVAAVSAGADILLMPADFEAAYYGIIAAVNDGTISEARIDASVKRIIALKMAM